MTDGEKDRTDPWAPPPEGQQAGQPQAPRPRPWQRPSSGQGGGPAGPGDGPRGPGGAGGSGGAGGAGAPRRTPPTPYRSSTSTLAMLLALFGLLSFGDPYLGVIFGLGGAVLGGFAVRDARRAGAFSASAVTGLAVGATVALLGLLVLATSFVPAQRDYQECRDGALTHTARQACEEQFEDRNPLRMGG